MFLILKIISSLFFFYLGGGGGVLSKARPIHLHEAQIFLNLKG